MTIKEREQFDEDAAVLAKDMQARPAWPDMPDIPRLDTSELEAHVRRLKGEAQ